MKGWVEENVCRRGSDVRGGGHNRWWDPLGTDDAMDAGCVSSIKDPAYPLMVGLHVTIENVFTKLVFLRPGGGLVSIQYGGIDNLLDKKMKESNRG
ncbi:hypothetical protein QJS04_geneDACA023548 [Acorus gramineus]|uniref:Uncharacterized protein n=1 Tax=Acorus gramineus TaxID=55184 RepID=A0AAV9BM35_ACOGR|nr:hypothetical protein QJS04_geneDACA023548 [Acorus gramineus]